MTAAANASLDNSVPVTKNFNRESITPPGAFMGMAQELGEFNATEVDGAHETLFTDPTIVAQGVLQVVN